MSNNKASDEFYEEYTPSKISRLSLPNKKMAFSTKLIEEPDPFEEDAQSPPGKFKKKSTKSKLNQGNKVYNNGRWSKEEHEKFLEAIKIHGRNWRKVQEYVGTRTSTQARSHAQKVLPHPSSGEGITGSHNSTSTTLTKNSPISNKNFFDAEFKKAPSVSSDENNSEFAIFKVEKVRKPLIGRSRVNSENIVLKDIEENSPFTSNQEKKGRNCMRKCSMNVEFSAPKTDLMNSPIKEPIKEHIFEDDEEEIKEVSDINLVKHNTFNPKPIEELEDAPIFRFHEP